MLFRSAMTERGVALLEKGPLAGVVSLVALISALPRPVSGSAEGAMVVVSVGAMGEMRLSYVDLGHQPRSEPRFVALPAGLAEILPAAYRNGPRYGGPSEMRPSHHGCQPDAGGWVSPEACP